MVQDWQNGDISVENHTTKGVFIDICGYYWIKDCNVTKTMLCRRHPDVLDIIDHLIDVGIIKYDSATDQVHIEFLDEQYDVLMQVFQLRSKAGSSGGRASVKKKKSGAKTAKGSSSKRFRKPSIKDIAEYCKERGNGIDAEKFYSFYESRDWMTGPNKMKDWRYAVIYWEKKAAGAAPSGSTGPVDLAKIKRAKQ